MEKKKDHINYKIDCPIFSKYKKRITDLITYLEGPGLSSDKVDQADEFLNITDIIMRCPKYDKNIDDCHKCRFFLNIKKEIAKIIISANKKSSKKYL
ncbi:MAG TPA: hypothetical protein VFG01_05690 [Acidobacteriota bacterium]|nr:hypothetical protein [Acidobacteriota bacterium]